MHMHVYVYIYIYACVYTYTHSHICMLLFGHMLVDPSAPCFAAPQEIEEMEVMEKRRELQLAAGGF